MTSDLDFPPLAGGCRCGQVRVRIDTAPIITHCCHCRNCQKQSGSAFAINAMIETDRLVVTAGEPEPFTSSHGQNAFNCPACRSTVWWHIPQLGPAIAFVGAGVFDEGERLPPEAHYFTRSKHPWITLPPDLPAFEGLGHPQKPAAGTRITAALGLPPNTRPPAETLEPN
jgi:hypothetical protein